jgi:Fur family peroxide stress response transcriptional regulator
MDDFAAACRRRGLKLTHQRTEVFRELSATDEHPDAETLYRRVRRRIPAISRDTVYRTLATLEEQGLIRRAETYTGAARFDANTEQHHHFVCVRCGRVSDFYSDALDRLRVPRSVAALGTVESAHVQVRGICRACRKRRE